MTIRDNATGHTSVILHVVFDRITRAIDVKAETCLYTYLGGAFMQSADHAYGTVASLKM